MQQRAYWHEWIQLRIQSFNLAISNLVDSYKWRKTYYLKTRTQRSTEPAALSVVRLRVLSLAKVRRSFLAVGAAGLMGEKESAKE